MPEDRPRAAPWQWDDWGVWQDYPSPPKSEAGRGGEYSVKQRQGLVKRLLRTHRPDLLDKLRDLDSLLAEHPEEFKAQPRVATRKFKEAIGTPQEFGKQERSLGKLLVAKTQELLTQQMQKLAAIKEELAVAQSKVEEAGKDYWAYALRFEKQEEEPAGPTMSEGGRQEEKG